MHLAVASGSYHSVQNSMAYNALAELGTALAAAAGKIDKVT